jgi:hypothetical protein
VAWCLLLSFMVFSGCASKSEAPKPAIPAVIFQVVPDPPTAAETALAFERELQNIIDKKPAYVWGGSESEEKGLDCSGYIFLAARRSGLNVNRTTAFRMAQGDSGWKGMTLSSVDKDHLDLIFWTFTSERPHGHVGAVWEHPKQATHASGSKGCVVVAPIQGPLEKNISRIRRLELW